MLQYFTNKYARIPIQGGKKYGKDKDASFDFNW